MKKNILCLFALVIIVSQFASNRVIAQCTPDPTNTALITPDTTTNFVSGTVGQPYTQVVYVHPPDDTTANVPPIGMVTVTNIVITVDNISNLPPGLTVACNPASCAFNGGVSGCLLISGTPTTAGLYNLSVNITTNGDAIIFGNPVPVSQQDTIESYRILINPDPSGINTNYNPEVFEILNINTSGSSDISVKVNAPSKMRSQFQVIDLIGKTAVESSYELSKGINNINIPSGSLKSGIYLLKVTGNSKAVTGRFVVAKNR